MGIVLEFRTTPSFGCSPHCCVIPLMPTLPSCRISPGIRSLFLKIVTSFTSVGETPLLIFFSPDGNSIVVTSYFLLKFHLHYFPIELGLQVYFAMDLLLNSFLFISSLVHQGRDIFILHGTASALDNYNGCNFSDH